MGIVQFAFHVNGARSHDHHRLNFTFAWGLEFGT
jgi:hypothetical protein